jgi:uncharacterized C2H2 Zn-finger protein
MYWLPLIALIAICLYVIPDRDGENTMSCPRWHRLIYPQRVRRRVHQFMYHYREHHQAHLHEMEIKRLHDRVVKKP